MTNPHRGTYSRVTPEGRALVDTRRLLQDSKVKATLEALRERMIPDRIAGVSMPRVFPTQEC